MHNERNDFVMPAFGRESLWTRLVIAVAAFTMSSAPLVGTDQTKRAFGQEMCANDAWDES